VEEGFLDDVCRCNGLGIWRAAYDNQMGIVGVCLEDGLGCL
jgi:hypothetical protein